MTSQIQKIIFISMCFWLKYSSGNYFPEYLNSKREGLFIGEKSGFNEKEKV